MDPKKKNGRKIWVGGARKSGAAAGTQLKPNFQSDFYSPSASPAFARLGFTSLALCVSEQASLSMNSHAPVLPVAIAVGIATALSLASYLAGDWASNLQKAPPKRRMRYVTMLTGAHVSVVSSEISLRALEMENATFRLNACIRSLVCPEILYSNRLDATTSNQTAEPWMLAAGIRSSGVYVCAQKICLLLLLTLFALFRIHPFDLW